jgi:acetate kinase
MKTLVLNSGSSSIKYSLFDSITQHSCLSGLIEKIGEAHSVHRYSTNTSDEKIEEFLNIVDHSQGLQRVFKLLTETGILTDINELSCIGHRVVHGGEHFRQPVIVDTHVIKQISNMIPLAPLHNPANLLGIEQSLKLLPNVAQVAVFDTAFHQSLPPHAYRYAVPEDWYTFLSVRRYGFHGTSHYYVAKQAATFLNQPLTSLNLITLHLGNGASITAIEQGQSIDTSMGLTPLEGLIMGTRSGDIDPALHFYLQRRGMTSEQIESALNKNSGLKGICAENDMRSVHKLAKNGSPAAQLALEMYAYRIKKYLGAYYAILGHVDAVVFTGGIGENDVWLRARCCENLMALGISIDPLLNQSINDNCCNIAQPDHPVAVLVVKTEEELEIATQALACIAAC